jgi:transcriptional regulator with XRE-family HTH domain
MPHRGLGKRLKDSRLARLMTQRQIAQVSGWMVGGFPYGCG